MRRIASSASAMLSIILQDSAAKFFQATIFDRSVFSSRVGSFSLMTLALIPADISATANSATEYVWLRILWLIYRVSLLHSHTGLSCAF